jgi:hypothetical protein
MDIMTGFVHYPVGDLPHETPSSDHNYYYDNITDYDDISPMVMIYRPMIISTPKMSSHLLIMAKYSNLRGISHRSSQKIP